MCVWKDNLGYSSWNNNGIGILDLWHYCSDSSFSLITQLEKGWSSCCHGDFLYCSGNQTGHVPRTLLRIHRFVGVGCFSQVSLNVSEQSVRKYYPSFSERTHDRRAAILSGNLNQANATKQQSCTKMQKGREAGKADASRSPEDRNWRREGQES